MFKIHYVLVCILLGCFGFSLKAQNWSTAIHAGGAYQQTTTGIAELADGSKIIVGDYRSSVAVFGSITLPWTNNGTGSTNSNSFIVKYSPTNTVVWATRIASTHDTEIASVSADAAGNIYVCGAYRGISSACRFYNQSDLTNADTTLYHSSGVPTPTEGNRGFVAKYSSSGNLLWARLGIGAGMTDDECFSEIAVNPSGTKVVVTGRIDSNFPITVNSTSSNGVVGDGSYVLWLDPASGSSLRGYNYSNDKTYSNTYRNGLCIDHSNNVIVAGRITAINYTLVGYAGSFKTVNTTAGTSTVYAKYSSDGIIQWARATSASTNNTLSTPSSIVVDDYDDIYLGGGMSCSSAGAYDLLFPSGTSTNLNIPVSSGSASIGNAYVVKLNKANGYAKWTTVGRGTKAGYETVSLTKGPCDLVYVGINSNQANPSFKDSASVIQTTVSPAQSNFLIYKLKTNGEFNSTAPWVILNNDPGGTGYIHTYKNGKVQCGASINSTVSLQTSGSPISLTPNGRDVILSTFIDNSSAPTIALNITQSYCAYDDIQLSGTVTGTGPFTITWNIYDSTSGTYVNLGNTSSPNFSLSPAQYNPYIFTFYGYTVIYLQVIVTNCSGQSAILYQFIGFNGAVIFSQVDGVNVCYTPGVPTTNAVFSVNAVNATSYQWQYSSNSGASWFSIPGTGYIVNQNQLTVVNPGLSQNNFLFRCIMYGPCNTAVTNGALLTVVPCPGFRSPEMLALAPEDGTQFALYPNPVTQALTVEYHFDQPHSDSRLIITDLTGRILSETDLAQQGSTLQDVSQFANGAYLCLLAQGGDILKKEKFIVQH